jgi:hypothetical protein
VMRTRLSVEKVEASIRDQKRVVLGVQYGEKMARIELPLSETLLDGQPTAESYGSALHELLRALSDWEQAGGVIDWHDKLK